MVVASLWLLVRGHDAVGGGFIGGLTAGAAVVLLYFSRGHERIWQSRCCASSRWSVRVW
jgi:multisubunit Na+/H+ antiporter MnhB subunit